MSTSTSSWPEDPWDWNVDHVVAALCDHTLPFRSTESPQVLPDAALLEQKIREHCVAGCSLLTDVNNLTLKDDLGIFALGQRGCLMREVQRLRRVSRQYSEYICDQAPDYSLGYCATRHGAASVHSRSSVLPTISTSPPGTYIHPKLQTSRDTENALELRLAKLHDEGPLHTGSSVQPNQLLLDQSPDASELFVSRGISDAYDPSDKSAKLRDGSEVLQDTEPQPSEVNIAIDRPQSSSPAPGSLSLPDPMDGQVLALPYETTIIDKNGKQRRRLILSATTLTEPEDQCGPTTAETNSLGQNLVHDQAPVDGLPASIDTFSTRDPNVATPKLDPNSNAKSVGPASSAFSPNGDLKVSHPSRKPEHTYLGIRAFHVDDIFYERGHSSHKLPDSFIGQTILDEEEGRSDDFCFLGASAGNGQRQYVQSRIQHFLCQEVHNFRRGGKRCSGIRPYPDKLGSKHQPLSITILRPTSDGVLVTRENRANWILEGTSKSALTNQRSTNSIVDVINMPISFKEADDGSWDYLEKWNHLSDPEKVHPIYGESGSEGEYDLDTWHEIEKERGGKLARPRMRSQQLMKMTEEEVLNAVNIATQQMIEDWKQKRLPRLSRTAWLLWSKSRRNRTKEVQINSFEYDVQHHDRRLEKFRKAIVDEKWTSVARVLRQCESLRRTIYELEDLKWKIATLRLRTRPEKPEKLRKDHPGKTQDLEPSLAGENVNMDSSGADTSQDEDLDDFVVDDHISVSIGDDGTSKLDVAEDAAEDDGTSSGEDSTTIVADADQGPRSVLEETEASQFVPKTPKQEVSSKPNPQLPRLVDIVDLTLDSDESESEKPPTIRTPASRVPKNTSVSPPNIGEAPAQRSQRKKALFKVPPRMSNVVDIGSDSAYDSPPEGTIPPKLPDLHEWTKISNVDPNLLMERTDRKRLLIWILSRYNTQRRKTAYTYISSHNLLSTQEGVMRALKSLLGYRSKVSGIESLEESETLKSITAWFICWTNAKVVQKNDGANRDQIEQARGDEEGFEPFYHYLHDLRCLIELENSKGSSNPEADKSTFVRDITVLSTPTKSDCTPTKQKRKLIDYSADDVHETPVRKRKYQVPESQEAAGLRKQAHERVLEREERQRKLKRTLQKMGQTEDDPSQVVVNLGKHDNQELIYLPPSIGARIQPHQKEGVRFLWREIIEDQAAKQGCLLAQTMGLGKTMQVISFLVTVAEAANSASANVRSQIPQHLRESRTLVLCPPSLIENWYEEFLMWAPDNMAESIGDIRKVSASMLPQARLRTIQEWAEEGGILLLGYWVLRELIVNNERKGQKPLDDDQHSLMTDTLLNRPNIVVADEAHMAKNRHSKLYQIFLRFSAGSRIALTGSPLSNNLSEYYALIEWVAPGYLGEHREFLAHYEEPIQEGLYRDSPAWKWRRGLKKLELFKREVQPKVHRADISVLASRLKGKSEFVIKVPLTILQEQIYQAFVDSMNSRYKGTEGPQPAALWALVSILRLVCNHPRCFYDRLMSKDMARTKKKGRRNERAAVAEELGIADEDEAIMDASPQDLGLSDDNIQRQLKPINDWPGKIDSVALAYKMKLLLQILELAKATGDKVLVFSHSLLTLDYVGRVLTEQHQQYLRLDGAVMTARRQKMTKKFNEESIDIFLISTTAGGTGLNLFGANRVIILDDNFNPTWEEQAIGRAYRIGQMKHVYVYRLTTGGTFEEALHNQSLFKQQLATRAVDHRNIARLALRSADYFQPPKIAEQKDLAPFKGKDPDVLDKILDQQAEYAFPSTICNVQSPLTLFSDCFIRDIVPCETFRQEVEEKLTAEEQKEVEMEEEISRLRRTDPTAYHHKLTEHQKSLMEKQKTLMEETRVPEPQPLSLPELQARPSPHPNLAARPMPLMPVNSNPTNLPPYSGVSGGPFISPPFVSNTWEPSPGAKHSMQSPTHLSSHRSQGTKMQSTAPASAVSSFPAQENFGQTVARSDPRLNTFGRVYMKNRSVKHPQQERASEGTAHRCGSEPFSASVTASNGTTINISSKVMPSKSMT